MVTRPVGAIPEFFDSDKMGALIEGTDPKAFAKAVTALYAAPDRLREIARFNRSYAWDHSRPPLVVERLDRILQMIIGQN